MSAALMLACALGMFFVSSPQQVLMVEVGEGGGELLAGVPFSLLAAAALGFFTWKIERAYHAKATGNA